MTLFAGTSVVALGVALAYRLSVAQTLETVLLSGGAPAALYLTWATLRFGVNQAAAQTRGHNLTQLADELALAVRVQWQSEVQVSRLHDPYPLPVRWKATDPSLVEQWDTLMTVARSGLGWPTPPPVGLWATGPDALAGVGDQLRAVLTLVPTGRILRRK